MKPISSLSVVGGILIASLAMAAPLPHATPESQGVDSAAILRWVEAASAMEAVHSFVLVRHGKVIAEGAWAPYALDRPHQLYSHSKSFTATAVGFLVDDGKLDLDELVCEIFPEKFPADADARMRMLRVRDLLTMNTGCRDSDYPRRQPNESDWVKSFFRTPTGVNPGTRYRYDSCATHVLAAIVEKRTGRKLMDFLDERLFRPLDFGTIYSHTSPTGVACGGWGMYARTPDLAKFGLLYLNEGAWNGRQILSRDWVRLASAKQTMSGFPPARTPITDWTSGYGFQFWRCRHNAYRADGSHGQFTVIMPDQDAVLSTTSCIVDMGRLLQITWDILLPAMTAEPRAENPAAQAALAATARALTLPVVAGAPLAAHALPTETFAFADNRRGYETIRLVRSAQGLVGHLTVKGIGEETFPIGDGVWAAGAIHVCEKGRTFENLGDLLDEQPVSASGAWTAPNRYSLKLLFTDQAHRLVLDFVCKDGAWTLVGEHVGLGGCRLSALSEFSACNSYL
ncbi:MAG: serine hydrolase domain-containing protein [Kiritimatiellia bacterium]